MTEEEHAAMAQAVARAEMQGAEQEIPTLGAKLEAQKQRLAELQEEKRKRGL